MLDANGIDVVRNGIARNVGVGGAICNDINLVVGNGHSVTFGIPASLRP